MSNVKRMFLISLITSSMMLIATTTFAKSFSLKDAGISLWIFLIIGAMLILLQLIPAGILFFSFIGSASTLAFKPKKIPEEKEIEEKEKLVLPGGPVTVQK
jgi:hypothetical protein